MTENLISRDFHSVSFQLKALYSSVSPSPLVTPVRGAEGPAGRAARSYLAVCGTDRDSDIGGQHDCEGRGQFNSETTVEEGGGRGERKRKQKDIFHR